MNIVGISCVKDGAKYLPRFLDQQSRLCSEVFILDDRSTDNIKEICSQYSKVHYFRNDEGPFHGGRNWRFIYSQIAKAKSVPEFIIGFDVDDLIIESQEQKFLTLLEGSSPEIMAWSFPSLYCWEDDTHYRIDNWYQDARVAKVFRYCLDKLPRNVSRHNTSLPESIGKVEKCDTIGVLHFGYMTKEDRLEKFNYYTKRDKDMIEKGDANYLHMLDEKVELEEV